MSLFNILDHQHTRYNPLIDEWILVSPQRAKRPWSGKLEKNIDKDKLNPDNNPLSPGALRTNGIRNPEYESTFVFDNDFPALLEDLPEPPKEDNFFFQTKKANGKCRVICFHPKSDISLPLMTITEITKVIEVLINESRELGKKYEWIQIFENKGDIMGCSNPHPHCQIWASSFIPNIPYKKDITQREYYKKNCNPMLMHYLQEELNTNKERIVLENDNWISLVPFWAIWPYETMLLPKKHKIRLEDLENDQIIDLAHIMKSLLIKYDNLFQVSFPYTMGWHGAPTGKYKEEDMKHWTLHASYYPPLLRSAEIKKFMVGYEMLAQPQRDITPEQVDYTYICNFFKYISIKLLFFNY